MLARREVTVETTMLTMNVRSLYCAVLTALHWYTDIHTVHRAVKAEGC